MTAPTPSFFSADRGHTSNVASRRIARAAARRLRNAVSEMRATKTSIGKARSWLPPCDADIELQLEVRKLGDIEKRLLSIAHRFESAADPEGT